MTLGEQIAAQADAMTGYDRMLAGSALDAALSGLSDIFDTRDEWLFEQHLEACIMGTFMACAILRIYRGHTLEEIDEVMESLGA